MTATSVPPTTAHAPVIEDPDTETSPRNPRPAARGRDLPAYLGWAELALCLVTVAAVAGFARLFEGWSFFWPLATVAVYCHGVALILRRLGRGLLLAAGLGGLGFVMLASWLWFFDSTVLGVPTPDTLGQARTSISASWTSFHELQAPVPVQTGLLLASAVALFFAVFLADWAAFRLWSPIEALVPTLTLFVFGAVLGSDQHRVPTAVVYCAAVTAFLLLHRLVRIDLAGSWISGQAGAGGRWLLTTGAIIAVAAVLGGGLVGSVLPGTGDPIIDWRGDQGRHGPRVTVSPLVDIRSRLVDQSSREVFTVASPQAAYWRMTALDTFDGTIWRSGGRYQAADGALPATIPDAAVGTTIEQTFTITGLSAIWLPAAYQPIAIDPGEADVRYQSSSSTLIVDTDLDSSDELTYVVESEIPAIDPQVLAETTALDLDDDLQELTELPPGFSPTAEALAQEIVASADASTPYEQALALQDFFQDVGVFADDGVDWTYDLESVSSGHDVDAIDEFLARGSGYCEQFAGTYAAMARSLGIPSRVAVGFTWGDESPTEPGVYVVSGRNAHAWPEVWLGDDVGWVSFEPTPGRGQPGQEAVTNLPQNQDGPGDGPTPPTSQGTTPSTQAAAPGSTTTVPTSTPPTSAPSSLPPPLRDDGNSTPVRALVLALVLAVAVLLVAATPVARRARHRRLRAAATTPERRIDLAWNDAVDDLALAGVPRSPAETHREYGTRAQVALPAHRDPIAQLASTSEIGAFAGSGVDEPLAGQAERAAAEIHDGVRRDVPAWRRLLHELDPRTLRRR